MCNLHYKFQVAKLGTAASGNFLSGMRERQRERDSLQHCQIKQDFRVAKKALKFIRVNGGGGGIWGADTCKARVAQQVSNKFKIQFKLQKALITLTKY